LTERARKGKAEDRVKARAVVWVAEEMVAVLAAVMVPGLAVTVYALPAEKKPLTKEEPPVFQFPVQNAGQK